MGFNMAAPLECPSCGEYDICYEHGCVCPTCIQPTHPIDDATLQDQAISKWIALTPVMVALNAADANWGWVTQDAYISEVWLPGTPDGNDYEIHYREAQDSLGSMIALHFQRVARSTHDHPESWDEVAHYRSSDPADIIDWIRNTMGGDR